MTKGNRIVNVNVADNESNLYDMGFEAQELIDELVELSYMAGTIWRYSEDAHRDYIMEKMTINEIIDECNDLGVDLADFETEEG